MQSAIFSLWRNRMQIQETIVHVNMRFYIHTPVWGCQNPSVASLPKLFTCKKAGDKERGSLPVASYCLGEIGSAKPETASRMAVSITSCGFFLWVSAAPDD